MAIVVRTDVCVLFVCLIIEGDCDFPMSNAGWHGHIEEMGIVRKGYWRAQEER